MVYEKIGRLMTTLIGATAGYQVLSYSLESLWLRLGMDLPVSMSTWLGTLGGALAGQFVGPMIIRL